MRDKLLFDSVPLNGGETYGTHRDYPRSHINVWEQFQRIGSAPRESVYEEYPRGRVIFDTASGEFTIFADQCILSRKDLINQIKEELHLPQGTKLGTDPHYRCFHCLYGSDVDDDSDDE